MDDTVIKSAADTVAAMINTGESFDTVLHVLRSYNDLGIGIDVLGSLVEGNRNIVSRTSTIFQVSDGDNTNKIGAIKALRSISDMPLKDAKDAVEGLPFIFKPTRPDFVSQFIRDLAGFGYSMRTGE